MTPSEARAWIDRNARAPQRATGGQWQWFVSTPTNPAVRSIHRLPYDVYVRLDPRIPNTHQPSFAFNSRSEAIESLMLAVMRSSPKEIGSPPGPGT